MVTGTVPAAQQDVHELLRLRKITVGAAGIPTSLHFDLASLESLNTTEERHFWSTTKRNLIVSLMRRYSQKKNIELLDIGCGNGSFLQSIERVFPAAHVTGIDGYPEALLHCRARTQTATLLLGDITSISPTLAHRTYDVVTALDVLEHLDHPEIVASDLTKHMNAGGIFIVTVPAHQFLWSDRDVFLGHRKRYSKRDLVSLLSQSGWQVLHANYYFSYLVPPVLFYRKVLCRLRGDSGENIEKNELKEIPVINVLLTWIGYVETWLSMYLPLPFGTSVFCVARKERTAS